MNITSEDKTKVAEILNNATQGKYLWGNSRTTNYDEHLAYIAKSLSRTDDQGEGLHMVFIEDEQGEQKVLCYTGNGPTSKANALLFTMAPQIINALLLDLDELTAKTEYASTEGFQTGIEAAASMIEANPQLFERDADRKHVAEFIRSLKK